MTPKDQNREIWRDYDRNEPGANLSIDEAVRARMSRTGETYKDAMNGLRADFNQGEATLHRASSSPASSDDVKRAGDMLNSETVKLMQRSGVEYKEAFAIVCTKNPAAALTYHRKRNYQVDSIETLKEHHQILKQHTVIRRNASSDPVTQLSNICGGLPRLANGTIDFDAAVPVVERYRDLAEQAARDFLDNAAVSWMKDNVGNKNAGTKTDALAEMKKRYPSVNAMLSGTITPTGLRQLLWPKAP